MITYITFDRDENKGMTKYKEDYLLSNAVNRNICKKL